MANIVGTNGNDTLNGTEGPDTIDGLVGTDLLYGKAGNDTFIFSSVQYSYPAPSQVGLLDGGSGVDTLDVSAVSPYTLGTITDNYGAYVAGIYVGNQRYEIANIEIVHLGQGNDSVFLPNVSSITSLYTGGGNDNVGTVGSFNLHLEDGDDVARIYAWYSDPKTAAISGGAGVDTLVLGDAAFTVDVALGQATAGSVTYSISGFERYQAVGYYGASTTTIRGGDANEAILVEANDARSSGVVFEGRGGDDTLTGSHVSDLLHGGDGNDTLSGRAGADSIFGGDGNDFIVGAGDGDTIDGGAGFDVIAYDGLTHAYITTHAGGDATVGIASQIDIITGVEEVRFRDATLTFDEESNAAFVMRLYDSTLDRQPDAQGLDYWLDQMDAGVSKSTVANAFLQSLEFAEATGTLSTGDFIDFLYTETLGRSSDAGGKTYWVNQVDGGLSRGDALLNFSESAEHKSQTADTLAHGLWITDDNYQAIAALYDTFTNRLPDEGGLGYWVGQLQGGESLGQIAASFAASPEFTQATSGFSNGQLVDFMYENTLDRPSDAGGRAYWVGQLDAGLSKGDLIAEFSESAEHYGLIGTHIYSGVDYFMM